MPEHHGCQVTFYAATDYELRCVKGGNPRHRSYTCGSCGNDAICRLLGETVRPDDGAKVMWCVCCCSREEPVTFVALSDGAIQQHPPARQFHASDKWPPELAQLFAEGAGAFTVGAYTAASMVCRKLLMAIACDRGDVDGKSFTQYVTYITDNLLAKGARDSVDWIRKLGNDATHSIQFVTRDDAHRSLKIATYLLDTIYVLPNS